MRKYGQKVVSDMYRIKDNQQIFLLRQSAEFCLGTDPKHRATVFMTNPGSFDLKNEQGWDQFVQGLGTSDTLQGSGYPDLTMQNVIEVINKSYESLNKKQSCHVEIINLSTVCNPKGSEVEAYHEKVENLIGKCSLLYPQSTSDKDAFKKKCDKSDFIILGFVKGVFVPKVEQIRNWANAMCSSKIVVAKDDAGWYSHPRRWRTEKFLHDQAKDKLSNILRGLLPF